MMPAAIAARLRAEAVWRLHCAKCGLHVAVVRVPEPGSAEEQSSLETWCPGCRTWVPVEPSR